MTAHESAHLWGAPTPLAIPGTYWSKSYHNQLTTNAGLTIRYTKNREVFIVGLYVISGEMYLFS